MKRTVLLLLSLLLVLSTIGCRRNGQEDVPGGMTEPTNKATVTPSADPSAEPSASPTAAPAPSDPRLALLPDWPTDSLESDWLVYENVSPSMLGDFISLRESEGFTLLLGEGNDYYKALVRGDAWIEIADNTDTNSSCEIAVTLDRSDMGAVRDEAMIAIASAEYYWSDPDGPDGDFSYLICITPEGLYEKTGLSIFRALYVFEADGAERFSPRTFVIGAGGAKEVRYFDCVAADIDGDGSFEAVFLETGPLSGFFSLIFEVFGVKDGGLTRVAVSGFVLDYGLSSLAVHDGKAYYVWQKQIITPGSPGEVSFEEPREFELYLDYSEVLIEDPDGVLNSELMAHFN
ncbi:MAG: PT domain-containing protein [Clostridiales bacterium]|nr:PT domain-containing protein [Clostridiales bacterium]